MKKKRKLRKSRILLLVFIIILLSIVYLALNNKKPSSNINNNINTNEDKKEEQEYKLSLVMVGDALIHDAIYKEANKNANYNGYDFKPMLRYMKEIIPNYDLAYYNGETVLGGTPYIISGYPAFNSPQELGRDMIDTGFNIVSLATNHVLDKGVNASLSALDYWSTTDVYTTGSYKSNIDKENIKIKEKNNITYAVLNYTYGTNGIKRPKGYDYVVNIWDMSNKTSYESYKKEVEKDIDSIRDKVDLLIVAMHWGIEYNYDITEYQIDAAKFLSSKNVDIITGTHPHVVEPITYIDNTLVIYSLGNFISTHQVNNIGNKIGLMTSIDITKKVLDNNTSITLSNLNNELLYTYHNNYKDIVVVPFSNKDIYKYLNNANDIYNKYKNIVTKLDNTITVNPIYSS